MNDQFKVDQSLINRFNAKWKYTPGCWLWTAAKHQKGYGHIRMERKSVRAHRLSYEMHVEPIPAGLHILHKCDAPSCVNPDHLFLGTNGDNVADKISKGRGAAPSARFLAGDWKGEANGRAKLTASKVIEIRALIKADELTGPQIAELYGITNQNVNAIKLRKNWRHI